MKNRQNLDKRRGSAWDESQRAKVTKESEGRALIKLTKATLVNVFAWGGFAMTER